MVICECVYGVGRVVYSPCLRPCPIRKEARVNNSRHNPVHAIANRSKFVATWRFSEEIWHREIRPHFTLLVFRLIKSIITYSPSRKLVVKYALPWAISVIRLTNSTR